MATISHKRFIIHPYKFNLWLAIVTMVMMFAAFTSAYVVKKGDTNNWVVIELPQIFTYSTILVLVSSVTMQIAYMAFKRNKIRIFRGFIFVTFLLGVAFLYCQVTGWNQMYAAGTKISGAVSGSFIYVISGAHFVHILGGVIALLVFSIFAFTRYKTSVDTLLLNINPDRQIGVELLNTYWHFVGFLWIYLFIFFQFS